MSDAATNAPDYISPLGGVDTLPGEIRVIVSNALIGYPTPSAPVPPPHYAGDPPHTPHSTYLYAISTNGSVMIRRDGAHWFLCQRGECVELETRGAPHPARPPSTRPDALDALLIAASLLTALALAACWRYERRCARAVRDINHFLNR